jgi:hypothetical protein
MSITFRTDNIAMERDMNLNRREFMEAASIPVAASLLNFETSVFPPGPCKVFYLLGNGESNWIIARSGQEAAYWWYTELTGGEEIPVDLKISEVDPDQVISCRIEDLEERDIPYLHFLYQDTGEKIPPLHRRQEWLLGSTYRGIAAYLEKPAKIWLQEAIDGNYPIPSMICTTEG